MAFTISQIVESASKKVERRAEQELDLRSLFWEALGEFVLEKRYPWRRKTFTFNTIIGTQTYDLGAALNGSVTDFYEMVSMWRIDSATAITELIPLVTQQQQLSAQEAITNIKPSGYMIDEGTLRTVRLDSPADNVYKIRGKYFAAPDPNPDDSAELVPLVPPQLHWGLVIALERNILRYLYGQNDPRSVFAEKRYDDFLKKAARLASFTSNISLEHRSDDQAIRAFDAFSTLRGTS